MLQSKIQIKKNDKVKVIAGKDKGKIGKVVTVVTKKNRVIIENINMIKNHQKPNNQNRQGGIVEREAPVHISNVMLMCNKCMNPVRIKKVVLDDGKRVRACGKCNEVIDA